MSEKRRVPIELLHSGVPGLDEVIGGGLPRYSFNIIAGGPGAGKTTLANQIMFATASPDHPALYITVLGEPTVKMLRYQQQMSFFDPREVGRAVHYVSLSDETLDKGLNAALEAILEEVRRTEPGIVVVDSFRSIARAMAHAESSEVDLSEFLQRLVIYLATWQATSFLVGEYGEPAESPVFTVADGILWLSQAVERNSIVRKLQVMKMRGQGIQPGLHTFRLTGDGVQVFPRIPRRVKAIERLVPRRRVSMGVPGLDEMMGGGIPQGDAALVAGPAGSGKSILCAQFIAEGVKRGEPGVIAVFEEYPEEYVSRAKTLGFDLEGMLEQGKLKIIYLRPLDLSVDETLHEIRESVREIGAKRVVIDSISGFELALAPTFRDDFRESLYRLVGTLTGLGVTILLTVEVTETYGELRISPQLISFLTDDVILLRYVEFDGRLRKVMAVLKMRSSEHSEQMRAFDITSRGVVLGETLEEYGGIITGVPRARQPGAAPTGSPLTTQEKLVLETLADVGESHVAELAEATGLRDSVLQLALDRLVMLKYVSRSEKKGKVTYRLGRPEQK